jgi:3-isopropylmalate dehydrogenase
MLRWLGIRSGDPAAISAATRIEQAVVLVMEGGTRTPDLGGRASTSEVGTAVAAVLKDGSRPRWR